MHFKKILSLLLSSALTVMSIPAFAFDFPQPDWGQLLSEREAMVTESDFELYVEGDTSASPYFGARLEPRSGVYLGMIAETSSEFQPLGCYLTYIDDMNQPDLYYPANETIANGNATVMVGWVIGNMETVDYSKVRSVLDTLNAYNKPMFIRFANEMNVSSLGDEPGKYIEVFRNVANIIHEYPNFAVVWAPNDLGGLDRPFEYYYPGDEYVDWVGVNCYDIKYFLGNQNTEYKDSVYFMTGDYSWTTNRLKPIIDFMEKNNINKPVMISEGGVATNNSYGENLEYWASPRLRNMLWNTLMKYPQVKMINYFNTYRDNEIEKFDISNYGYAANIFKEAENSGAYIRYLGSNPDFVYQKANDSGTLQAKNGILNLYTLAYIPGQSDFTVNYFLDGNWYHSSNQIPYTCGLSLSGISDGQHTITISAFDKSETYTFIKSGQYVSFGDSGNITMNTASIKVLVNGECVEFDQQPILENNRTLVPLRAIFEALNATVDWYDLTQTVTAVKGNTNISLQIDSTLMTVNQAVKTLDVPAKLVNSRTLVPVRAVSEAFGCDVKWDDANQTVIITE